MNSILLVFSSTAVAVYGVCSRMIGLCTVGVHGINCGLIPIVAYYYGAGKPERIRSSVRWALIYSGLFYAVFLLVLELFPETVLKLFNASGHMLEIGVPAVRIFAVSWLICIPSLVISASMQGLSLPRPSMVLTMLRQAALPVLLAFLLSLTGNLNLIWFSFLLAEAVCIPLALRIWRRDGLSVGFSNLEKRRDLVKGEKKNGKLSVWIRHASFAGHRRGQLQCRYRKDMRIGGLIS